MTPERYQLIGELFDEALERAPAERSAFLKHVCGTDDQLHTEVEKLLANHSDSEEFLSRPALHMAAALIAQPQRPALLGQKIGHYQVLSLLGAGGMGEVYLAEDARLRRKIALKVLPASIAHDQNRLRRFEQEAFAASALNHPNILTIYEFGIEGEIHFLAAEFIDGETLRTHLQRAPLLLEVVLDIVVQTAQALSAAHAAGIIHRDIKPENIMLRRDGLVKVLDFGLAKLTEASKDSNAADSAALTLALPPVKTHSSTVMGTPNYMSPEQARGMAVDARTDIFSLGILLYEMLTGKTPFACESTGDVIAEILKSEPAPLSSLIADLPGELERIVEKTLRKNREERYQNIEDLLIELRDLKSELDFQTKLERSAPAHTTGETRLKRTTLQRRSATNENLNEQTAAANAAPLTSRLSLFLEPIRERKPLAVMTAVAVIALLTSLGAYSFNTFFSRNARSNPPNARLEPMKQTRLTTSGAVCEAKISPDGQFVAYLAQEGSRYALYVWEVADNSTITVLPPADNLVTQLDFAPDSQYIFYLQTVKEKGDFHNLYKVPTLGGASEKIVTDIDSMVSFGPEGRDITFRREYPDMQQSFLYIAGVDGTGERVIAERQRPNGFTGDPAWSPDGKTIAAWVNEPVPDVNEFSLLAINVADGSTARIGSSKWRWPRMLRWLPDGSGLLANGTSHAGELYQIYHVAYPGGNVMRVTNDFNKYEGVSVTTDGSSLVTVQSRQNVNIFVGPASDPMNLQQITSLTGVTYYGLAWTPTGQIVYGANAGGRRDIWIMDADGKRSQRITNNNYVNYNPAVTADGRFIVYQSERTGKANIWRMSLDGSNPTQLTDGDTDLNPDTTPDGRWVVYAGNKDKASYLGKVSIDGGEPQEMVQKFCASPVVSRDGRNIACAYRIDGLKSSLAVVPVGGGEPIKNIVPVPGPWQWSTDSRALICVDNTQGFSNLFSISLLGGEPKPLTSFKSDRIFAFALSHDGKKIAFVRGSVYSDVVMISNFH